jgi:hypothetical protein
VEAEIKEPNIPTPKRTARKKVKYKKAHPNLA